MTKLTSRKLKLLGACSSQIALFKELGRDTKEITLALCVKHASQFDWNWAAKHLLSPPALAEYERVKAPALAEYKRVEAPALAKYERVEAPALAEYKRVEAPALAEYERVKAPALAEYERMQARTFWMLYQKENQ